MSALLKYLFHSAAIGMCFLSVAQAADHIDAPLVRDRPKLDITDVYAFRSPVDPARLVLALNLFTPVGAPDSERLFASSDEGEYAILIDTDGDTAADHSIRVTFSDGAGAAQTFTARGIPGSDSLEGTVSTANAGQKASNNSASVFAGLRDDPFFFDFEAFNAFLAAPCVPAAGLRCPGTGSPANFFNGLNVAAIVVEFPITALSNVESAESGTLNIWAETTVK